MRRSLCTASLIWVTALSGLTGCHIFTGDPVTSPTNEKANLLAVADTGAGGSDAADGTVGDTGGKLACDCLKEGDWYRFDTLQVKSLDGGPHNVIGVLNSLWTSDIKGKELNFYFRVEKVSATEVTVKVVNGARVDGTTDETCLLPYTEALLVHPRNGCTLDESAPSAMNVYAGTQTNKKNCAPKNEVPHSIEVRKAVMKAEVTSDCGKVINGLVVSGALGRTALEQTCTCVNPGKGAEECGELDPSFKGGDCDGCSSKYQNLKTLLQNFGELKWACEVDGKPAVCLQATFSAVRLDQAPKICP